MAVGGCDQNAALQWTRRPTEAELETIVAAEEQRRADLLAISEPNNPPNFPTLPTAADTTVPAYGCVTHEVSGDLSVRVHQASCTAPNPANLPGCDCTPEPAPLVQH
jgi:hypothetical protein